MPSKSNKRQISETSVIAAKQFARRTIGLLKVIQLDVWSNFPWSETVEGPLYWDRLTIKLEKLISELEKV